MIVKVCGMRDEANAREVAALGIDLMGFIFFERSARFVGDATPSTQAGLKRVGVFVNSPMEYIVESVAKHKLDFIQLHGNESPDMCRDVKSAILYPIGVIKAISIASKDDITKAEDYDGAVDMLLFDTKCTGYGGSGVKFDWSILNSYHGATKFLLSGGIDVDSADDILAITHPKFAGVDLNSRFEISPALKDVGRLKKFLELINR